MSVKESVFPTPAHILDARGIAETISKKQPQLQIEMLAEIKKELARRFDVRSAEIKDV